MKFTQQSVEDLNRLESLLRDKMKGRSLLCEVPFKEDHCDKTANLFAQVIRQLGPDPGRRHFVSHWPLTYAVWLSNEAFFNYQSGAYWPFVLDKLGVQHPNAYSSKFGRSFLDVLDRFKLPRFKRLTTHWNYLGPILAHAGIPRSCLPDTFEHVLPKAVERGVLSRDGFQSVQEDLPSLRLTRAVEWFIRFGDSVAEDFVRRSADLYRAKAGGGDVREVAARLPERVWKAFDDWWASEARQDNVVAGVRVRKPTLTFDPWDGLRLALPSQACEGTAGVAWIIQVDTASPEEIRALRLPGEASSETREVMFAAPFGAFTVRLVQAQKETGFWSFAGLTQQHPVLFFEPDSCRVLPGASLDASELGVSIPSALV